MDIVSSGLNIDSGRLYAYAASAAKLIPPDGVSGARAELRRLRADCLALRRFHASLQAAAKKERELSSAQEWILDNYYLIERESKSAAAALRGCGELRSAEGESIVFALCRALLRSGGGRLSGERLANFLDGFQSVCVLRQSELEALAPCLRCAVISAIAEVCRALERGGEEGCAALLSALFAALRLLPVMELDRLLERVNVPGLILERDATGEYPRMDAQTKRDYLGRLARLAAARGAEEQDLARALIERSQREGKHVGFFLFEENARHGGELYIAGTLALTAALTLLAGFVWGVWAALLLTLPISETVESMAELVLSRLVRPKRLPRMDLRSGVPPEGKTVCVVSVLLSDPGSAARSAEKLERLYHACGGEKERGALAFGLLADLPGAAERETENDGPALASARAAIDALNARHGGGFCLLTRPRSFDGERWCGRERKRGALCALARLLCGEDSELQAAGDAASLSDAKYILTLDSDTEIYPGAVGELIGAAIHPLNRARIDPQRGTVTGGHGILQPRIGVTLRSAVATDFAILFAGAGGSDPYGSLCGEPYMDAFDAGGFSGKGLIDAAALLACTETRFEGKGVLSHDAPEGAYLHGARMSDEEFFDAFPASPAGYYRRLHRWVRGDWQNLRFLFARELPPIERRRFFDKLRRSAVPPATLAALLAGFFFPARAGAAAAAAVLCLLSDLIPALTGELRSHRARRQRSWTRSLAGLGGAIVQNFMRLWLLPWESWICLSAALTALWRMLFTHKKLLQWETAAQSERRGDSLGAYARAMIPVLPVGLAAMCLSAAVIGRAAGLMWLLSPVVLWALSLPAEKESVLSAPDAAYLRETAAATWRYFSRFCTREDNALPPDNVQLQPMRGAAHSISPTNLGLAMCAAAAACDLGVIGDEEAMERIGSMTDTAERMERYRGHFYNWYDTRTLAVLRPAFVSTVDSGNLCAALLTAAAFAREKEAARRDDPRSERAFSSAAPLSARLFALAEEMDFSFLYDETRSLFYICYDTARERGAGGWYDLMASEAMLTSYLAVARGEVPRRHWRALGRAQLGWDGYRALASWTGSVFEYLMPFLFLPLPRGSLLDESGRFCLYAQRHRVPVGTPWGISESAFFSLDASGRYRYKAHGVAALALRRGMDEERVVSPYSSFLALAVDKRLAAANLRRLERYGARGTLGFFEAVDFTPQRGRGENGEVVRCVMAHHAAMSLCAAANALCGNSLVRRFLSDARMAAFLPLLCERPGEGGELLRRKASEEARTAPRSCAKKTRSGRAGEHGACLLSNGAYTLLLDEMGEQSAAWGERCVCDARTGGMRLRISAPDGESTLMPSVCARWEMSAESCRYEYDTKGLRGSLTVSAGAAESGALYELSLAGVPAGSEAILDFTPLLAPLGDWLDHPAFARLGIRASRQGEALLLRRIARRDEGDAWLAVCCSLRAEMRAEDGAESAVLLRPHVTLRAPLEAGENALRFALCVSSDADEAAEGARRLLGGTLRGDFVAAAAALLRLPESAVFAAADKAAALRSYAPREAAPRGELWRYGFSGDLPLLLCPAGAKEEEELLGEFCLLRSLNIGAELALTSDEEGEYPQETSRRVTAVLARSGLEALLGAPGGVRIVPRAAEEALASRAAFAVGREEKPREPMPSLPDAARSGGEEIEARVGNGSVSFLLRGKLPPRPWQNILCTGDFGWIASECGSGPMWLRNLREGRIDPPPAVPESVRGAEQLWAETPRGRVSLFAAEDGIDCSVYYDGAIARWEKTVAGRRLTLTGFLDPEGGARVLQLEGAEGLRLCWRMELLLGAPSGASVRAGYENGLLRAENPESFFPELRFLAAVASPARCRCDWAEAGFLFSFTAGARELLVCGCCGEERLRALCKWENAAEAGKEAAARAAARLGRFFVRCSDAALEHYLNGWCLAQIRSRLEARGSLYQSGGAIGFRDQLQDAVNLLLVEKESARSRILDCCRHQYREGDVMHWWHVHPEGDRGVRTRCSDDLLWLCWALGEYVEATGEEELCFAREPYLLSPPLGDEERDRYERAAQSEEKESVLDHALRALRCCVSRGFGAHGLPLMGSGDWNDSLSNTGGESVWLAFFLCACGRSMATVLKRCARSAEAEECRALAARMLKAAEGCFNGKWYERAYPAHGDLGRGGTRIDSIVQSWAVFCGAKHAREALDHTLCRLVDGEARLVKLLDPPFAADEERFGYISSYGEGCRENGGQYTHAAVWLARASFLAGRPEAGREILSLLLPEGRESADYGAEPYVLAADVCSAPGHRGEAGWSWYTGSAGWFFRTATENLLGIRRRGGRIVTRRAECALFSLFEARVNGVRAAGEEQKGTTQEPGKMI